MRQWVVGELNSEFIWKMENTLSVYDRPYDPDYPVVCLDESGKELSKKVRDGLELKAGQGVKEDTNYTRLGMRNLFMAVEPLRGWRHVQVTAQRTGLDYAHFLGWLVEEAYPEAIEIQLVQDNLNTHTPGSLYKAFTPERARKILERVRFHYTPTHGSWLNMAEIEIGIFKRQGLDRHIESEEMLKSEIAALEARRNEQAIKIDWQFKCEDARVTFQRFYARLLEHDIS